MKTLTQFAFTAAVAAILLGSNSLSASSAFKNHLAVEAVTPVTFNKISISGNVKVILIQANKEAVKVDENFDPAKTSIKRSGYKLVIYSSEINPVTVTVCIKDLQRIEVSGISSVETRGKFNLDYLQIFMSYSSTANINAKTGSLFTVISDAAELKLSGTAKEHTFVAKQAAKQTLKILCAMAQSD